MMKKLLALAFALAMLAPVTAYAKQPNPHRVIDHTQEDGGLR